MSFQLNLPLVMEPSYAREDFITGETNKRALLALENWPNWPSPYKMIVGPSGSGKSHLGSIWRGLSGARLCTGGALCEEWVKRLSDQNVLLDDADELRDEKALFHLLNQMRENGKSMLLLAQTAPGQWLKNSLPDLQSRLKSIPVEYLLEPDDAVLGTLLVKLFSDRGLRVDTQLINYILTRMERRFDVAVDLVNRADDMALSKGRAIGRGILAECISNQRAWSSVL